jgi:hypothetical protein
MECIGLILLLVVVLSILLAAKLNGHEMVSVNGTEEEQKEAREGLLRRSEVS